MIAGVTFQVSNESFFQVNTSIVATLIEHVLDRLQLNGAETVLDAYCGVGLFTRFIAARVRRVIGIETNRSAVADAHLNLADFDRVAWHLGAVEEVLPKLTEHIAAAVIDPPRAGCAPEVIATLIARSIDRVVYVSCDPATLARDAKSLIAGGYRLSEAQPIDLFPHTYHIETVAHFQWMGQGHV